MTTAPDVGKLIADRTRPATRAHCQLVLTALGKRRQAALEAGKLDEAATHLAHIHWLLDRMPAE